MSEDESRPNMEDPDSSGENAEVPGNNTTEVTNRLLKD